MNNNRYKYHWILFNRIQLKLQIKLCIKKIKINNKLHLQMSQKIQKKLIHGLQLNKILNQVGNLMIYEHFYYVYIKNTQKYSPNAKNPKSVPDDKNSEASNPTDNSFINDL